uniref:MSP domain-containing protein n=2 Tax=Fagus sylvatica TaxID=28930 RepID=A0A2N9IVT3_FAGSY
METLVEVLEQEARIDFALNCKCRAIVRLKSLCATTPIAFKVQTSSPNKFLVNPPSGLVPPLAYATFQIILKPQTQFPPTFPRSPSDRFLIKTAEFTTNPSESTHPDSINSWFSTRPHGSTQDLKLKVAFVGPVLLRHAVGCGDVDSVRNLIKRQKSILTELSPRRSRVASPSCHRVESRWAAKGWDELHVAVAFDQTDEILSLIKSRGYGSLDCRDKEGRTPLHLAASKGSIWCARLLVESGADMNARCKDGRTALHRAATNGDRQIVEMLIEFGADPAITNDRGQSPLDAARDKEHESTVTEQSGGGGGRKKRKEVSSEDESSKLVSTSSANDLLFLSMKLEAVNTRMGCMNPTIEGFPPKDKEVVEILERGEVVLMAARRGELEHLESLLQKGATMNYCDQYGLTALHAAAIKGHRDAVLMLAKFGLDLECKDNEGHAPLHLAVEGGSLETVEVLVEKGADVNAKTMKGVTPLYIARAMGYDDISEFLISRGASSSISSFSSS